MLPVQRGPLHGFFHFFFGYFVPVFEHKLRSPGSKLALVDSGPFNSWFRLLPGTPPQVISQSDAIKIGFRSRIFGFARGYRVKAIVGWDKWLDFPSRGFFNTAKHLRELVIPNPIQVEHRTAKILVFGRNFVPDYYKSDLSERYGAAKRDIPNLEDAYERLRSKFNCEFLDPAQLSPEEIMSRCASAHLVVGQHGAALCNIFFLHPGSGVLEIGWPELAEPTYLGMYGVLAEELGLHWVRPILQEDRFSPISPERLEEEISLLLEKLTDPR